MVGVANSNTLTGCISLLSPCGLWAGNASFADRLLASKLILLVGSLGDGIMVECCFCISITMWCISLPLLYFPNCNTMCMNVNTLISIINGCYKVWSRNICPALLIKIAVVGCRMHLFCTFQPHNSIKEAYFQIHIDAVDIFELATL